MCRASLARSSKVIADIANDHFPAFYIGDHVTLKTRTPRERANTYRILGCTTTTARDQLLKVPTPLRQLHNTKLELEGFSCRLLPTVADTLLHAIQISMPAVQMLQMLLQEHMGMRAQIPRPVMSYQLTMLGSMTRLTHLDLTVRTWRSTLNLG